MASPYGLLGQQGWQGLLGKTGNFLGNNSSTLTTMGAELLNYSRSPVGPIFNQQALAYGMKGDQEKRQQKKTQKFLMDKFGMSSQEAEAGAGNKDLLNLLLKPPKNWTKLDDNTLFDPVTGETKELGGSRDPIKMGKDETLLDPDTYAPLFQNQNVDQADSFDMEQKLRKEWAGRQETQNFNEVLSGYERLRTAAEQGTGPGDVAVVIGYMKMLDPGSVVREGEYATVRNASGVPEQIRSLYNRMVEGDQLSPEMRQQIVSSATALYEDAAKRQSSLADDFTGIADQYNVDPSRIVRPVPQFSPLKLPSGGTLTPLGPGEFDWNPQ